jgi:hypothetical protein
MTGPQLAHDSQVDEAVVGHPPVLPRADDEDDDR